jgi:hypothetical protein
MSKIEVNAIEPQSGTTLTLGASGDTITIPAGATISNSGTAAGFGPTGAVSWNTTKITANPNPAVTGVGYFCDTTSAAFTVTLPSSPAAGAVVGICDYANTFATNNLTVGRNSSNIGGAAANAILSTNGVSVTFVYVDATQGWIVTDSGNRSDLPAPSFVAATGGCVVTSGDYKIHTFTGPGTFTVSSAGNSFGSNSVDYLVVAGGAGGGGMTFDTSGGGGGGAGGFRMSNFYSLPAPTTSPLASPTGITVTATAYPISVGAGGAGGSGGPTSPAQIGVSGSNSVFSTITSAGGGGGGGIGPTGNGASGGSGGGGGGWSCGSQSGGSGNTPPVSPSQGNPGGGQGPVVTNYGSAGGGGAGAAGGGGTNTIAGAGGVGSYVSPSFAGSNGTPGPAPGVKYFAGGGGGSTYQGGTAGTGGAGGGGAGGYKASLPSPNTGPTIGVDGTVNTGGGGGGNSQNIGGKAGGSGIVVIRYKFQ